MSTDYVELHAQGNVYPVFVKHRIWGCGDISDGVSVSFGDYGGGLISFGTLTAWWLRALWYRLSHPIYWIKVHVMGRSWTKRKNI